MIYLTKLIAASLIVASAPDSILTSKNNGIVRIEYVRNTGSTIEYMRDVEESTRVCTFQGEPGKPEAYVKSTMNGEKERQICEKLAEIHGRHRPAYVSEPLSINDKPLTDPKAPNLPESSPAPAQSAPESSPIPVQSSSPSKPKATARTARCGITKTSYDDNSRTLELDVGFGRLVFEDDYDNGWKTLDKVRFASMDGRVVYSYIVFANYAETSAKEMSGAAEKAYAAGDRSAPVEHNHRFLDALAAYENCKGETPKELPLEADY